MPFASSAAIEFFIYSGRTIIEYIIIPTPTNIITPKIAFKIAISNKGTHKAITYPYRQDAIYAVKYAVEKGWTKVSIE